MDLPSVADIRRRLPAPVGVPVPTVLEIDLTRGLLEAPATDPLSALRQRQTPMLTDVVAGLRRGSRDPSVVGAVVLVGAGTSAITQAEELGAALRDFSAADKQCVAWAETFGELGAGTVPYYLAAHAGQVWMQPTGMLGLTGVALSATAIRGVLDKLGVEPQIGRRHEYKSAAESITESTISEPNREMTQRLVDSVMEQVRARLVESRGVSEAEAKQVDAASPMSAARAVDLGLVDRLAYRDELYAAVRGWGGEDEVRLLFAHRYAQHQASRPGEQIRRRRAPVVAVVEVRGGISMGRSQPGGPGRGPSTGSDTVCAALRLAGADESVKAVVLRVDSPGGSYLASDAIRRQVLALRETGRPVVVSMAELAASGGYFVSMPADHIVASPGTLTGSIGVFGGKVVLSETFDKIGLVREAIGSGAHATMFATTRPFSDEEWGRVNQWLDDVYADFTHKAAEDRGLEYDVLEPMARGRVWTGADACERGLVDSLGGFQTALAEACRLAELDRERVRVARLPRLSALQRLRPAESTESPAAAAGVGVPDLNPLSWLTSAVGVPGVLALPWRLRVVTT